MKPHSISVKRIKPVMWNDPDTERDERPRNVEEQVQMRRARKTLEDCELPEGFRLVTPQPKQFWMSNQLVWGFKLAWAKVDGKGNRGVDEYYHVARYEPRVSDEVQMRWALEDFGRELQGSEREERTRGRHEAHVPVFLTMRVA